MGRSGKVKAPKGGGRIKRPTRPRRECSSLVSAATIFGVGGDLTPICDDPPSRVKEPVNQ